MRQIVVRPNLGVWIVEGAAEPRVFTSGSEAERWARTNARIFADAGEGVELRVFDLRETLIGSIVLHPTFSVA